MRMPVWKALRWIAFGLLGFVSLLALAQSELEPGGLRTAMRNLDIQASLFVLLLFVPTLTARLKQTSSEAGLSMGDRTFACAAEAALYGFMLIQPIAIWLVAILDQLAITILGVSLPSFGLGNAGLAGGVNIVREVSAGLVLLFLALHVRNRGLAILASAAQSFVKRGFRSHGHAGSSKPSGAHSKPAADRVHQERRPAAPASG